MLLLEKKCTGEKREKKKIKKKMMKIESREMRRKGETRKEKK